MTAYVFFKDGRVCHVVLTGETDARWAQRFCKRRGYHDWQVTEATDSQPSTAEIDAMYPEGAAFPVGGVL